MRVLCVDNLDIHWLAQRKLGPPIHLPMESAKCILGIFVSLEMLFAYITPLRDKLEDAASIAIAVAMFCTLYVELVAPLRKFCYTIVDVMKVVVYRHTRFSIRRFSSSIDACICKWRAGTTTSGCLMTLLG